MVKLPEQRLGGGPPGSMYDFEALKQHPFFDGLDFDKLNDQKITMKLERKEAVMLPEPTYEYR